MGKLLLIALALFLLTRKKYYFSFPKVFIPKLSDRPISKKKVLDYLSRLDIRYVDGKWRVGVKPVNGIPIPIAMYLPKYTPIALPQIALQLKNKLIIDEVKVGDYLIGYWVRLKEPIVVYM